MAWKYFKITSGGSSSTEFNPKEFNILAGTTQCQVGGTITSDRAPSWSTLATSIDGSLTTATYWTAGTNPTVNITMPAAHTDLTAIEIHHTFTHNIHSVWLSENNIDWIPCPYVNSVGSTQNFSIPALVEPDPPPVGEGWKYVRVKYGVSVANEVNPYEINVLAGAAQTQIGGTIESTRAPQWSINEYLIDGNLTTAAYWPTGEAPTVTVTLPTARNDLTKIQSVDKISHALHTVEISTDKIAWFSCPNISQTTYLQEFSIPALPEPPQNEGTPVNWILGTNVSISNGTVTKTGGGNAWNGGAKGDIFYQADDALFVQVTAPKLMDLCFGFTERDLVLAEDVSENITYKFDLYLDGTYRIYCYDRGVKTGTYKAGDTFKVELVGDGTVDFLINNVFIEGFAGTIFWPMYIDCSLYKVGDKLTASISGGITTGASYQQAATLNISVTQGAAQNYTPKGYSFEQASQLNIGMSEAAAKIYTAKGYNHSRWTLNFLDYYYYTDQVYTPNGYEYEQTATEAQGLTQNAAQTYTAKGYGFIGADSQEIIFDFGAVQTYTPEGYSFEQSTQENIFVDYIGAQTFAAEGYERATMAQENILLVSVAAQVYTNKGYAYEATTGQTIEPLTQEAAQVFAAHFEQEAQENLNLSMQAAQIFAARFENQAQLNFVLDFGASQSYTAIGYTNENNASDTIKLDIGAAQTFAARFERFGTQTITLGAIANAEYQANFRANAHNVISVVESGTQAVIFSEGLQFQQNTQNNINVTYGAAQEFTPFGGYSFNQNSSNEIIATAAASLLYELGEIGKYSQRASLFLNLQGSTQTAYTRNWLDFESDAAENMALSFGATSEHIEAHIFEDNAAEVLTYFISPLQFYGQYLEGTDQQNIGLSINAASVYTNVFNEYEGTTLEPFYLHHTDKSLHEIIYLSFTQNMYYDFLFWHFADVVHEIGQKVFEATANENTSLFMAASVQYTNANMLNGFATENINLTMAANSEHIEATIYEFNVIANEDIYLDLLAASNHIKATIYEFVQKANESIGLTFGAVSEHIQAHIFTNEINENITLLIQEASKYQNINPFTGKAKDLLMFEHWATFEVTTEPRNYEAAIELTIELKIVNWVYFESDIYKPTYKLEIDKPNTLWEPTDEDRPNPYIFGRNPDNKIDRRILHLTDIEQPKKISYEKPNTLYTHKLEIERGLIDD